MSKTSMGSPSNRAWRVSCAFAAGLLLAAAIGLQASAEEGLSELGRGPLAVSGAEDVGIPDLANASSELIAAEVRLWVWHRGEAEDHLLRLWQVDGRTYGELQALSADASGLHVRHLTQVQEWSTILRELEALSVWTIPAPQYAVMCIPNTHLLVESYRDGQYRRVAFSGVGHYPGAPQALYDYVRALAVSEFHMAAAGTAQQVGCG